jgi:uncharacterized protein YcaQ
MSVSLTLDQALAFRWHRQHLDRRHADVLDVVSDLCGLHAQLLSSAAMQLAARVDGIDADALGDLLWRRRALVKTWAMRGTLHLLPSGELALWHAALSTYDHYRKGAWLRAFGFEDVETLERFLDAIREALDGEPLTRKQLVAALERRTKSLKPAAFKGWLCFADNDSNEVRFTRPDRWLELAQRPDPADALAEITRRYLRAYGPARAEDLARWWGVSPAGAKRMLKAIDDELERVTVDGTAALVLGLDADACAKAPDVEGAVRLLPAFDPYLIGVSRDALGPVPEPLRPAVYRRQGWMSPVILAGGLVAGTWSADVNGSKAAITCRLASGRPRIGRDLLEEEAARHVGTRGARLSELNVDRA